MTVRVLTGDCRELLPTLDAESVDAVVTDPPYGLGFMGKAWDTFAPEAVAKNMKRDTRTQKRRELYGGKESDAPSPAMAAARIVARRDGDFETLMFDAFAAAIRVAKPGAHLVAFGSPRRHHRLMCAIEDSGWEIRDCLMWLFGSGFPKSLNIGNGRGTALKPAYEPIILARKPFGSTVAANVQRHGTGALNVDACRIEGAKAGGSGTPPLRFGGENARPFHDSARPLGDSFDRTNGRWPANVVLDETAAAELDKAVPDAGASIGRDTTEKLYRRDNKVFGADKREAAVFGYDERGGASRFFYTAKAGRQERDAGLDHLPVQKSGLMQDDNHEWGHGAKRRNHHPTVKPLDLMQWLCRLVTPKGGLILDPFCGSGSTGRAAVAEGFSFIGIELNAEYAEIARARIRDYAPLLAGEGA